MDRIVAEWKQTLEALQSMIGMMPEASAADLRAIADSEKQLIALLDSAAWEYSAGFHRIRQQVREVQRLISALREASTWTGAASDAFSERTLDLCVRTLNRAQKDKNVLDAMDQSKPRLLYQAELSRNDDQKRTLRIFSGDLTETEEEYDIVACSAFKGDYVPIRSTLIGALQYKWGISVRSLAAFPELDLRAMGCWLSKETGTDLRRIACLELLDYHKRLDSDGADTIMLKSAFATLRFLLEQASIHGVEIRSIALPVLGAGAQGIDLNYIIAPLVSQCINAFGTIPALERIDFYEFHESRALALTEMVKSVISQNDVALPQVFVSYSSRQADLAHTLSRSINEAGYTTWIAPESIATGANYQEAIPMAINGARLMLLLLTEDAQQSKWVQKEVGSAIGAGKLLLPMQLEPFAINPQFRFLLEGEQIFPAWQIHRQELPSRLTQEVRSKLN